MAAETKVTNPFDQRVIASVPVFSQEDVRAAAARISQVAPALAKLPAHERAAALYRVADLMGEEAESLARLIARESGKPIRLAREEVTRTANLFTLAAVAAGQMRPAVLEFPRRFGSVTQVPAGVVAAITGFGCPLEDAARWLAPAIAAGCPLILKPSSLTPLAVLRLTDLLDHAGLPPGTLEVVLGDDDVARWLAADSRVGVIALTGRAAEAQAILPLAGLRPTIFDLHRSAVAVIDSEAHFENAAQRCAAGSFAFSGQLPICLRRIYIQRGAYDAFRDHFLDATAALVAGNPMHDETDLGPLISDSAAELVVKSANGAIEEGAWLLAGGEREGRMVAPLVLDNVDEAMQIMQQTALGPLVCLLPFDQLDDVLKVVNHADRPLGLFSTDVERAMQITACLQNDTLAINDAPARQDSAESLRRTIDAMTRTRTTLMNIGL